MIEVEYIIHKEKSLFTIRFNKKVMDHLNCKCHDYLNYFQSAFRINLFTIFKADTGYRIIRVPNKKKTYQINIKHPVFGLKECDLMECKYFMKKNRHIKFLVEL